MQSRATAYDLPDTGTASARNISGLSLRRFTWLFALFAFFNIVVVNGVEAWLSPGGVNDTVFSHSWGVLTGVSGDDSWGPMAAAREHIQEGDPAPLYTEIFFNQGIKFQYPPSALFALEAMMAFGEDRVRTSDEMLFPGLPRSCLPAPEAAPYPLPRNNFARPAREDAIAGRDPAAAIPRETPP